jgi:hypothetical protein
MAKSGRTGELEKRVGEARPTMVVTALCIVVALGCSKSGSRPPGNSDGGAGHGNDAGDAAVGGSSGDAGVDMKASGTGGQVGGGGQGAGGTGASGGGGAGIGGAGIGGAIGTGGAVGSGGSAGSGGTSGPGGAGVGGGVANTGGSAGGISGAGGTTTGTGGAGGSAMGAGGASGTGGAGGAAPGTGGTGTGGMPASNGGTLGQATDCCHGDQSGVSGCMSAAVRTCVCATDSTCCSGGNSYWTPDCAVSVERKQCGTCTAAAFSTEEGGYIRAAPWHGYAFVATESPSLGTQIVPTGFNAFRTGDVFGTYGYAAGNPDPTMRGFGLIGFNLNQATSGMPGGGAPWTPTGHGIYFNLNLSDSYLLPRIEITAAAGSPPQLWCAQIQAQTGSIPWSSFNTSCADGSGTAYDGVTPLTSVALRAVGSATGGGDQTQNYFDFYVYNLAPY